MSASGAWRSLSRSQTTLRLPQEAPTGVIAGWLVLSDPLNRVRTATSIGNVHAARAARDSEDNVQASSLTRIAHNRWPGAFGEAKHQNIRMSGNDAHANSFMNASWKSLNFCTNCEITSSRGRIVVRRWNVPSAWPKPEPGTVEMPVASSSRRQ
eukprot:356003-Chlamydomonas_euryale.AAC.1